MEVTKLGARTIGIDLDPLAWFIVSKQIGEFDEVSFRSDWDSVQQDLEKHISSYYKTEINGKLVGCNLFLLG